MENERNVSPVSAHGFNNEKPPCESRVVEAVENYRFPSSLSIETTLSIEFRRKSRPDGHIFSSLYKFRDTCSLNL